MNFNVESAINLTWATVAVVWIVGLAYTKRTLRSQSASARWFHIALGALGFSLLSHRWIRSGWLATRFVPDDGRIAMGGLILTMAGCAFAIWARVTLGGNWSGRATVKADHQLITNGPYALTRHPIYTGLLVAIAGTALAIGAWRGVLAVLVILLALLMKMSQEEKLMIQTFPMAYPAYRQRVKALIPGIF
jgi:protein-S-isoprenylcysteine O-methyltransferase Ste14